MKARPAARWESERPRRLSRAGGAGEGHKNLVRLGQRQHAYQVLLAVEGHREVAGHSEGHAL